MHGEGAAVKDPRWGDIDRQKALVYTSALSTICVKSKSLNYWVLSCQIYAFGHIFDMFHYCQFIYMQWLQHLLKITDTDSPCEIKAFSYGIPHVFLLTAGVYNLYYQK